MQGDKLTMDENHIAELRITDEIDLRELILVLWKKKIVIVCIAFTAAFLSGLVSKFLLSPVYESKLDIIINMPGTYHTKYGDYYLPISTNEQYINLITSNDVISRTIKDMDYDEDTTIESLIDRISIYIPETKTSGEQNSFYIKVSAKDPEEARNLAHTLYENYLEFIDLLTIEAAVDYYIKLYSVELSSLEVSLDRNKELLVKNEALLAETPQTINQKEAMDEIYDYPNTSDYIVLEKIINPNYTKIETDVIEIKQTINNVENSIRIYKQYMEELNKVKESLEEYKSNGNWDDSDSEFKSITKANIHLPSAPIAPSVKTSPHTLFNCIIGAVLGGMVGVVSVLVKKYWNTSNQ